jgi:hypothetical protein
MLLVLALVIVSVGRGSSIVMGRDGIGLICLQWFTAIKMLNSTFLQCYQPHHELYCADESSSLGEASSQQLLNKDG